jgi:hypothetical protein
VDGVPKERFSPLWSQQQMGKHVDEIQRRYEAASKEHREAGHTWYEKANEIAHKIGKGDVRKGAGILSALSPMTEWGLNVRKAEELVKTGTTTSTGGMQNVRKAQRILEGQDPDQEFSMKTGPKTYNFYKNIADPSSPHYVTIDRHAYNAAVAQSGALDELGGKVVGGKYNHFADAYKNATYRIGGSLVPQQVQATVWVTQPKGRQ